MSSEFLLDLDLGLDSSLFMDSIIYSLQIQRLINICAPVTNVTKYSLEDT